MSKKRHIIKDKELGGFKYFESISGLLERLHDVGCERDRAGNRTLHMDQYMSLILLFMFNPICSSLRALQQASTLKKVQKKLGVPRASLGSLSEAARVFDSQAVIPIIEELSAKIQPLSKHQKLDDLPGILTAVDGTLLKGLPRIACALWNDDKKNDVKNHLRFEILKGVPVKASITAGKGNEKDVLANNLDPGRIYVMDRGYAKYGLFQTIIDHDSFFACRIRDDYKGLVVKEGVLSQADRDAGIVQDRVLYLGEGKSRAIKKPIRVVEIKCTPHIKRAHTGRGGPEQSETIAIATNLMDVEAEVIALMFKYRWSIETFFRFYKHILGCRHLISYDSNGIELQTYAAIIACLLITLWTGHKPTLRTVEMLSWYFTGMASEEELLAHIMRLKKVK